MSSPRRGSREKYALSADELRAWSEDGFLIQPSVFREDELRELRDAAEAVVVQATALCEGGSAYRIDGNRYVESGCATIQFEHAPGSSTIRVIEPFHRLHPRLDALVDDPRLVQPMRSLVGAEDVSLWTDKLNLKRPHEGSRFRFHQDSPYWADDCEHVDRLPNVMIVLDEASQENGCLRVIRGSHRQGMLPGIEDESTLGPLFTDPRCFDRECEVAAVMPAGSLLFFSPHLVHGSEPNSSDAARRALVLTYQPAGRRMFKLNEVRDARPTHTGEGGEAHTSGAA